MEILDFVETPLGHLVLRRRELLSAPGTVVTEVTLAGELLMSSHYSISERALASRAMAWHGGSPRRVLVGGLGLGATADEVLERPSVEELVVAERLAPVIGWLERELTPLASRLLRHTRSGSSVPDSRTRLRIDEVDVFALLRAPPAERFDLVLLDVDHSPDELLDSSHADFYQLEGLERAREHLAADGVLAVWSSAPSPAFLARLGEVFSDARSETIAWQNEIIDHRAEDEIFLARR